MNEMNYEKFPYPIEVLDPEINNYVKKVFSGKREGYVQVGPKKYIQDEKYARFAEIIYNFEVRPDDVWIVSFPRSGTTLTQEIVWMILNDDYETASSVSLFKRFPYLEFNICMSDQHIDEIKSKIYENMEKLSRFEELIAPAWETLQYQSDRRCIKTHLPLSLLPPSLLTSGCKVIYIARNPKDVAVSCFFHNRSLSIRHFIEDFSTYWNIFENNLVNASPYWEHVKEGWEQRNNKNFLFMFYEDMVKDYGGAIRKLATFLDKGMTKEQVDKLTDYVRFDNFRKHHSNLTEDYKDFFGIEGRIQFVRKGKTGGWKDFFTDELNDRVNKWIEKYYQETDLRFPVTLE